MNNESIKRLLESLELGNCSSEYVFELLKKDNEIPWQQFITYFVALVIGGAVATYGVIYFFLPNPCL